MTVLEIPDVVKPPAVVISGALLAITLGWALPTHFTAGAMLFGLVTLGLIALLIPGKWIAPISLSSLSVLVVLFPVGPSVGLLSLGPVSGVVTVALIALVGVVLSVGRGPSVGEITGVVPILTSLLISHIFVTSVAHQSPDLKALALHWAIWASAFLLGFMVQAQLQKTVIGIWIGLGTVQALYALYEYTARPPALFESYLVGSYDRSIAIGAFGEIFRAQGSFGHPVPLGAFLVMCTGVVMQMSGRTPMRLATAGVLLAGLAVTFARSAWAALAVVIVVSLLVAYGASRSRAAIGAIVAIAGVGGAFTSVGQTLLDYTQGAKQTVSYAQRLDSLRSIPRILGGSVDAVVFGHGANSREHLYAENILVSSNNLQLVDNQYITLLFEAGLLGLLLFTAIGLLTLRRAFARSDSGHVDRCSHRTQLGLGLVGLLVTLVFFEGLYWPSVAVPFWSLIGMISRPGRSRPEASPIH